MDKTAFLSGQFLLAMPGMSDPRFARAVIAMCSHDENGAIGIGLGATIDGLGFHDLLEQFGIEPGDAPNAPVHFGGPVEPRRGFVDQADALKAKGVDEIACTSVNDAFVMDAWGKSAGAGDITLLADGNGDFAKAVGLTMDGSGFGMGTRSQRYSMIVNDGVVEQLNVEAPGEFKVSSAEHLLSEI